MAIPRCYASRRVSACSHYRRRNFFERSGKASSIKLSYALIRMHVPDGASRQSFQSSLLFVQNGATCCGHPRLSTLLAGTTRSLRRFSGMRIREENCNMVLLAAVTVFSVAIAGGAALIGFADNNPVRIADRMAGRVEEAPTPDKRIIFVSGQPPVRVVGAPFVPNTNPRER